MGNKMSSSLLSLHRAVLLIYKQPEHPGYSARQ